jgi:putative membrane protein
MPSEARRLHPFGIVSRALRLARQFLLPAVLGGASVGDGIQGILLWVFIILAVPSVLFAAAQWLAFRYRIVADDLVLDSGVLGRRRRVIPMARIQNVDLGQSALERLAGVAELRIETASGGRESEASLSVLGLDTARSVRAELLALRGQVRSEAREPPPEPLLRLSTRQLAVAGATANEAGLIAAGLATLLEAAGRFGALSSVADRIDEAVATGGAPGPASAAAAIALIVLLFLVLGWMVSIVATVVRFHGFTLTLVGDELHREYGLLSRSHTTVPLSRVQAVRMEETLPRRALGLVALKVDTAGAGPQAQRGAGGRGEAHIPIARRWDADRLLGRILAGAPHYLGALHQVAPASIRRERFRLSAGVMVLAAALWLAGVPRAALAMLLLAPAWLLARARFRSRGWDIRRGHVVARNGVFTRTTWVIPERKIQTLHATRSPFQRRLDLATVLVDTAASGPTARVVDLEQATARDLLERLAPGAATAG